MLIIFWGPSHQLLFFWGAENTLFKKESHKHIVTAGIAGILILCSSFLAQSSNSNSKHSAQESDVAHVSQKNSDEDIDPSDNAISQKNEVELPQLGPFEVERAHKFFYDTITSKSTFGYLHLPKPLRPHTPVVVLIHGGGWKMPTNLDYCEKLSNDLASTGAAVWNIEYRRVGDNENGGWPTTMADTARAIDYLVYIKHKYPELDLNQVTLIGHSSGGQLAAWAASRLPGQFSRIPDVPVAQPQIHITGLVTLAGVFDLGRAYYKGHDRFLKRFFGGVPQQNNYQMNFDYEISSPSNNFPPKKTRILAFHGDIDNVVNIKQSILYVKNARERGLDARLILLPGVGHSTLVYHNGTTWDYVRTRIAYFLPNTQVNKR